MKLHDVRVGILAFAIFSIACALFVFLPLQKAHAETKIAVVNVQHILSDSKAAKHIQKQIDTQKKDFQDKLDEQEKALVKAQKDLRLTDNTLSSEEKIKRKKSFEKQIIDARREMQKRRNSVELAAAKAFLKLRQEMTQVIADLADQNDYSMVITRQNIIIAKKEMDITDEVMKKLNKKVTKIDVDVKSVSP